VRESLGPRFVIAIGLRSGFGDGNIFRWLDRACVSRNAYRANRATWFTEIDLVSHSGNSASNDFCCSLNLTDIHTGWTETQAVRGKSQEAVRGALEAIRQALPFGLRGIDSDNGSELINDPLYRYCQTGAIEFTRGRPY